MRSLQSVVNLADAKAALGNANDSIKLGPETKSVGTE